jgi:hypothetical protein
MYVNFQVWRWELQMCGHPSVFLQVGIEVYEENAACAFRVEGLSTYRNTRGHNQDLDLNI